jgi:hypothetical protein
MGAYSFEQIAPSSDDFFLKPMKTPCPQKIPFLRDTKLICGLGLANIYSVKVSHEVAMDSYFLLHCVHFVHLQHLLPHIATFYAHQNC